MHRLACGALVIVALFVGLVVATLVTRSRTTPVESAPSKASRADLQIKQAEIEEQSGNVRWQLRAETALVFEGERRTALRKITVVVHDKERSWNITADEGDVRETSPQVRTVEVRKNVVVISSEGYRLETSVLRWTSHDGRIWADAPVRLVRDRAVVEGTGFELRTSDEATTVQGRVHALFAVGRAR